MTTPNAPFALGGATPNYTFPLPLSTTDPDEEPLVYVRLNQEWLKYLIGAVYYLRQEATWASTDYSLVCLSIARANMLTDMLMSVLCEPVCLEGIRLAGNSLQVSADGGETWSSVPNAGSSGDPQDPRTNEPLKPARTGDDRRCLAAANATAVFVELHRELSQWYNTLPSVLNLIYSIGAGLQQFFAALWQNFGLVVNADTLAVDILAHYTALNDEAFTSTIQDKLTCILYCCADENGQFDQDALDLVISNIGAETGEMWRLLEVYIEQVAGLNGLNNAGTTNSVATHDCEPCYCNVCPPYVTVELTKVAYPRWISPVSVVSGHTFTLSGTHSGGCYPDNSCAMYAGDYCRVDIDPPACVCGIEQLFARTNSVGAILNIHDTAGNMHQYTSSLPGTPNDTNWGPQIYIGTPNFESIECDYMILTGTGSNLIVDGLRCEFAEKGT